MCNNKVKNMLTKNNCIENLADLFEIDLDQVIDSFDFEYNSGEIWGFVDTPAVHGATPIAKKISHDFPYISASAVHEILVHVFDNVANYGMISGQAKGRGLLFSKDRSLEIAVANFTDRILPPTLNGKTYTVSDGVITVPLEERDIETGGGNGVNAITATLPYVYSYLLETDSNASVLWKQNADQVIFKLSIPTPGENELVRCKDYMSRREQENKAFDLARSYIIETKNPDNTDKDYEITTPAETAIPVLRDALRASVNFPENQSERTFELIDVLKTIQVYGQEASSASQDVIDIILSNAAAIHGMSVLMDIEETKGMYCNKFLNLIEEYQGEDDKPLRAMVDYLGSSFAYIPPEDVQLLKEELVDVFLKKDGQFDISKALKEEEYVFIEESVNRFESEGDCDSSTKLIDLYFKHVMKSINDRVNSLSYLPDGKLKKRTVERIAEVNNSLYAAKALEFVDSELQEPLVRAIVESQDPHYAIEALANENVSIDYHPALIGSIVESEDVFYACKALANERVPTFLQSQLVGVIVEANDKFYVSKALDLQPLNDENLRAQLESIK
ncbi:MAG: hypothetical protein KAR17_03435 [Cyclobacteriaceae bacterium]|nr:hypothetical protein [Cyclobacteriaceae bacterium]